MCLLRRCSDSIHARTYVTAHDLSYAGAGVACGSVGRLPPVVGRRRSGPPAELSLLAALMSRVQPEVVVDLVTDLGEQFRTLTLASAYRRDVATRSAGRAD